MRITAKDAELLVAWLLRQYPSSERAAIPTLAQRNDNHERNTDANRNGNGNGRCAVSSATRTGMNKKRPHHERKNREAAVSRALARTGAPRLFWITPTHISAQVLT
jgi:hypothetical protein